MQEGDAYRGGHERPRPYDPALRVRPCDACGAGMLVGDAAETRTCDGCGVEQRVPAAVPIDIAASKGSDETKRLEHLRTQMDHQWLLPRSVAKYGNVLEEEIDEARQVWSAIRRRVEDGDDGDDARVELLVMTFSLHSGMPSRTEDEQLARRALIEAAAEALRDDAMRQKLLGNMVVGAVRAGQMRDAKAWLSRLDPRSDNLDADSIYRLAAALLATDAGDHARVIELLGRRHGDVPIHQSSQGMVSVLRANALEKLGSVAAAVAELYGQIVRRHSALALIKGVVKHLPQRWALCEASLPLAIRQDHARLARNIHLPAARWVPLSILVGFAVAGAGIALGDNALWPGLGLGAALVVVGVGLARSLGRTRTAILDGCQTVNGRIVSVRRTADGKCDLDVVVERRGEADVHTTTRQYLSDRIFAMPIEGASFDALWNPKWPQYFPRITINVSGDHAKSDDGGV